MSVVGLGDKAKVGTLTADAGIQVQPGAPIDCGAINCRNGTTQTFKTTQADSLFLTTGQLDINGLATTNPGIGGRVWNDGGTLKIV